MLHIHRNERTERERGEKREKNSARKVRKASGLILPRKKQKGEGFGKQSDIG
jgi:hypothetical protein